MYTRIISFINKNDILYKYQFGFRENNGSKVALSYMTDKIMKSSYMTDKIMKSLDNGDIVMGIFFRF